MYWTSKTGETEKRLNMQKIAGLMRTETIVKKIGATTDIQKSIFFKFPLLTFFAITLRIADKIYCIDVLPAFLNMET